MHWDSLFPCRLFCSFPPELLIYLFAGVRSAQRYFDTPHDLALKGARFHDWADMGNSLGRITCYLHIWMEQIDVYLSVTYHFSAWKEKSILSMEAYWLICNRMISWGFVQMNIGFKVLMDHWHILELAQIILKEKLSGKKIWHYGYLDWKL